MKKYILIIAAMALSLSAIAATSPIYKEHKWQNDNSLVGELNRYSCDTHFFIKTTYVSINYNASAFFERVNGAWVELPKDAINGIGVDVTTPGEHIYVAVVGKKSTVINSPAHRAPQLETENITINNMPIVGFEVYQYDVYYCLAKPTVIRTEIYLNLDMLTNRADTVLKSTAGGAYYQNQYCQSAYTPFCEIWKGNTKIVSHSSKDNVLPYFVQFTSPGTYEYEVRTCVPDQNANEYERYTWIDRITIYVYEPECMNNLVYTKWDDVLFVDNGEGGGQGKFVEYQWYNEGQKIEGETKQWMRTKGTPSGRYYVSAKDADGWEYFSCPARFEALPKSQPNNPYSGSSGKAPKRLENGSLVIEHNGFLYNAQGQRLK